MNRAPVLLACVALLLGGCQVTAPKGTADARPRLDKRRSVEITPADDDFGRVRVAADSADRKSRTRRTDDELTTGELYELPKLTVTKKGFRKLGLSVVTNTEVAVGGPIEWMRVGVVLPDSAAARQRLFTGLEILAIDDIPVARLSREQMLHALFEREAGERVRLLVYSPRLVPLPRFVTL